MNERITTIATLAGVTPETVAEYIGHNWDNETDHLAWLQTATNQEIADWIRACTSHGELEN